MLHYSAIESVSAHYIKNITIGTYFLAHGSFDLIPLAFTKAFALKPVKFGLVFSARRTLQIAPILVATLKKTTNCISYLVKRIVKTCFL